MNKLNILKNTHQDGAVINPETLKLFLTIIFKGVNSSAHLLNYSLQLYLKVFIFLHIFSTHKNWEPT